MIVVCIVLIGVALYAVFIGICLWGQHHRRNRINAYELADNHDMVSLSLVVCCKNEENNLPKLLASIEPQADSVEQIILASDHSTDQTLAILENFARHHPNTTVFETSGSGKKNALKEAVGRSKSQYIVCTDADCLLPERYLDSVKHFLSVHRPDLMIGAVRYTYPRSIFGRLQALEFASLAATTKATAIGGFPIMCNGANIAFSRIMWQKAQNHLVEAERSGDDMFLLHYVKKIKGKILFFDHSEGFVETSALERWSDFYNQRKRWTSKSSRYTDPQTIAVAMIVAFMGVAMALSIVLAFADIRFVRLFFVKMLVDSALVVPFLCYSKQKKLIKYIPLLAVIYPFYILITILGGFWGSFRWKN